MQNENNAMRPGEDRPNGGGNMGFLRRRGV